MSVRFWSLGNAIHEQGKRMIGIAVIVEPVSREDVEKRLRKAMAKGRAVRLRPVEIEAILSMDESES